ncbi:MAG TPA: chemotaxis protein CheR [Prolixibacteraceae bacterium]|nr:chemotaxis protein CheR [Prolixibacteraceae bacterium]
MKLEFIQISDELFHKLGNLITARYGIKMPPDKKVMFQARMQRRLRELEINSFDEYAKMLLTTNLDSPELSVLADYISTNKTEFFREKDHFDFIKDQILPEYLNNKHIHQVSKLKFWSAGCSNGQEAYSIAIAVEEFMRLKQVLIDYSILATDISGRMLKAAKAAIYPISNIDVFPLEYKQRYLLKSKNQKDPKVRIIKSLREKVTPSYQNLMDDAYQMTDVFDVILLRNTLIYFNSEVQQKVLMRVLNSLRTGGYLIIGHSESLINMNLPIRSIAPSIYVKINI